MVAHPGAELYGSDRQLAESVRGLVEAGWRVRAYLPQHGPLEALLDSCGAEVAVHAFPVLRRSLLRPGALVRYARDVARSFRQIRAHLAANRPDVVLVNTVTIPQWLAAAASLRVPTVLHVHEAEESAPLLVRAGLGLPATLATLVVVNSRASLQALAGAVPGVRRRARVVYNGVPGPPDAPPAQPGPAGPTRLAVVGRLSPRKGTDVALEALARLVAAGHDVHLDVCGSVFPGYEWFEEQLRSRAEAPDLRGRVRFHGYLSPTWPVLAAAAVVLVPSRQEPFGNTAVEAMLAGRPVVASDVQGLTEIVDHERTGLLVPADAPDALAEAVARLLGDPGLADRLADAGRSAAAERFSPQGYRAQITAACDAVATRAGVRRRR